MSEKERVSGDMERPGPDAPVLPVTEKPAEPAKAAIHPAVYVCVWISLSSSLIIQNKWILTRFHYPVSLTTWHLAFATLMTQLMARFTTALDSRKKIPMTGKVYLRTIVPIGVVFSLSLICGNLTYLYLSVSFIQMLKATMPVAVLLAAWAMGVAPPSLKTLGNVSFIVLGVMIASFGEIKFVLSGFLYQLGGLVFEAGRLVMVEKLLSSAEFKMDPLVSLYYFAPACATMNGLVALLTEVPRITLADIQNVGYFILLANAVVAFMLNVSVVFLIGRTSSLVMTLCGVLKDILLVAASMLIFRDPVSGLQFFGYSIALGGLIYYKLGGEKMKEYVGQGQRQWADYGVRHPAARKLISFGMVILTVFVLVSGISTSGALPSAYDPSRYAKDQLDKVLGKTGA